MRAVLDTNVLISAFVTDGLCARILRRARNGEFAFVLCASVLEEFRRTLRDKFGFDNGEIAFFAALVFEAASEIRRPVKPGPWICRDAILACAAKADADFVITGNEDLLVLESLGKAKIIRPRAFELLF